MQDQERAASQAALVLGALYAVAVRPEGWDQLSDALGDLESDAPPDPVARQINAAESVARLARDRDVAEDGLGWILLDGRGVVRTLNPPARRALAAGLGAAEPGRRIAFADPADAEVLTEALARRRPDSRQVIRLAGGGEGGCFACLVPPALAPEALAAGEPDAPRDGCVLIFAAALETSRLLASLKSDFGLTPAEARLAAILKDGGSLAEAAEAIGVSVNTVRNQLRAVFEKMGLRRQSELVRAIAELAVLAELGGPASSVGGEAPPVQLFRLPDGRRLGYRDYGDPAGKVLLCFHEGLGSSLLPSGTDRAARRLGLRVLAADRPGFAESDPSPDYSFDGVAADMTALCDGLGLDDVRLGAVMSGTPSAIATAIRLGRRARAILLCSGRPPRPLRAHGGNPMIAFRAALLANPWVVEVVGRLLKARLSPAMVERMLLRASAFSDGDRAFFAADPSAAVYVHDYVSECLAHGARGPAMEIGAFRRGQNQTLDGLTAPVIVWHGEEDAFSPLPDLLDFLGDRATEVRIVPGIGHAMALKHWPEIMARAADL